MSDSFGKSLASLFADDAQRASRYGFELPFGYLDLGKTHLHDALARHLGQRFGRRLERARGRLMDGSLARTQDCIHPMMRTPEGGDGATGELQRAASASQSRMREMAGAHRRMVEDGRIRSIIHLGVGGSACGPRLLYEALGGGGCPVWFLDDMDERAQQRLCERCDPASTLVVQVSRSFGSAEIARMAGQLAAWMGDDRSRHNWVAVTADADAARASGLAEQQILPIPAQLCGRYSLWSAVSYAFVVHGGWQRFGELLDGAHAMDMAFCRGDAADNPVCLAAMMDWLYINEAAARSSALFTYTGGLQGLATWVQQLAMESLGKSHGTDDKPAAGASAPLFGGSGIVSQHSVFQYLHQAPGYIPVDMVAVAGQRVLAATAVAQAAALMGGHKHERRQCGCPGDRPSTFVLMERLDAFRLGALLAFYEHRVFCYGTIMGINSFDHLGVAHAKRATARVLEYLEQGGDMPDMDASSIALLRRLD